MPVRVRSMEGLGVDRFSTGLASETRNFTRERVPACFVADKELSVWSRQCDTLKCAGRKAKYCGIPTICRVDVSAAGLAEEPPHICCWLELRHGSAPCDDNGLTRVACPRGEGGTAETTALAAVAVDDRARRSGD